MEYEITMLANSESFQMRPTTTVTFQTFYYFMLWFTTNIWILLNNDFKLINACGLYIINKIQLLKVC